MTKQQELDALSAFRNSLSVESYLRPWLDNVFSEVQDAILSDKLPMSTYKATQEHIDAMWSAAAVQIDRARSALRAALRDIDRY